MNTDNEAFEAAFNHAMLEEVGKHWDPTDPDVIQGLIDTRQQKRKVGYVNIKQDRGGETKYGIAQNANPGISVRDLDLAGAMDVYYNEYWIDGHCDKLPYSVALIHFDGCINHGIGRANKILQEALGVTVDGVIGNQTLSAVNQVPQEEVIQKISDIRTNFYNRIVQRDASQSIFLNGWLGRISRVTEYSLSQVQQ